MNRSAPPVRSKTGAKTKTVKRPVKSTRKTVSWIISLIVGVAFFVLMALVVEARHTSFYGEPLWQKVAERARLHIYGLPENAQAKARLITGIPNLDLLPAEAVLPKEIAARFTRLDIHFAYVPQDVRPGNGRYLCKATNTDLIPHVAWNIAAALYPIPDQSLAALDLKYIVFCGDLFREQMKVGGFPVPVNDLMMLNLTHRTQNHEIQDLFLHEFYHLFEARHKLTQDAAWNMAFGAGYRQDYAGSTGAAHTRLGSGTYGFLNRYSETFPYEDRAEIFAMLLIARPQLVQFIIDQQDEMLYAKSKYVADTARKALGVQIPPF